MPRQGKRTQVPQGVIIRPLTMYRDQRGSFTEVFRREWEVGTDPVQWNVLRSRAGILRGVHVHLRHTDYILSVQGSAQVGLCDLRPDSATEGLSLVRRLDARRIEAMLIPPGVAHGFYFSEDSLLLHAASHYYDPEDEIVLNWDDPGLDIPWTCRKPHLIPRDEQAPSLEQVLPKLRKHALFQGGQSS